MKDSTSYVDDFVSGVCPHDPARLRLGCRECLIEFIDEIKNEIYKEGIKNAPIKEVPVHVGYGCPLCGRLFCNGCIK